jgi:hypothetical protein
MTLGAPASELAVSEGFMASLPFDEEPKSNAREKSAKRR